MVYNSKNQITKKTSKSNSIYNYAVFTSSDIFIQSTTNSQSFNRYITDNLGNIIGTINYDQNGNYDVNYNDGSGFGYDQDSTTGYTHDSEGQYTTQNLETGELDAGWDTGHYHQYTTDIETFTDSAINYHSISYKGYTIDNLNSAKGLRQGAMILDMAAAYLAKAPTLQTKGLATATAILSLSATAIAEMLDPTPTSEFVMGSIINVTTGVISNPAIDAIGQIGNASLHDLANRNK